MHRSPHTQPIYRPGLGLLSLGLLLLCGFIGSTSATPRVINQLEVPLFVDQIEQLALAGNSENLRARSTAPRDGTAPEDTSGADGLAHALVAALSLDSSRSLFYVSPPHQLPASARYSLPVAREPPKA